MKNLLSPLLLCFFLSASTLPLSAQVSDAAPTIAPGTTEKVVVKERARCCRRSYLLHVPAGFQNSDSTRPESDMSQRPLVIALHGGLSSGKNFAAQTGLDEIADRENFFVVYPNGMGLGPLLRHWNGGFCCAKAMKIDLDDPAFIDRVVENIATTYPVDRERIYVVGYSNGGMLAYWYAATRADRLAGLGVWGSSIGERVDEGKVLWSIPDPVAPIPTIVTHGLADPRLPWESSGERGRQNLLGAVGTAEAWAAWNGCEDEPSAEMTWNDQVERRTWCGDGMVPVVLLGVAGWDHDWPGPKLNKRPPTDPLHKFDLAEEMWSFFKSLR